jgi:hypothetical protein
VPLKREKLVGKTDVVAEGRETGTDQGSDRPATPKILNENMRRL